MPRIIDVVEVPDQGANDLVSRVPEVGSGDFRLGGSQVIVRESQNAIFYRDGKSLDTFGPGRHTITTANLPLISSVMSFSRADDVFTAEVFFVNLRGVHRSEVGDPAADQPPDDSELGFARVRGFGQYTIQIAEPKRFVGSDCRHAGLFRTSQIEDYLRNTIVSTLTNVLGENMTSLFDLPRLMDELGAAVKAKATAAFAAMGIHLKQLMVVSITPTDETAKAIDQRAGMGAIGNLDSSLKYEAGGVPWAMRPTTQRAAAPQKGIGFGAGIGLGAGMAGVVLAGDAEVRRRTRQLRHVGSACGGGGGSDVWKRLPPISK
jgi:membrane protease subunit (stomatin/prohibitin family)